MSTHRHRPNKIALRKPAICVISLMGWFACFAPAVRAQEDGPRDFGDPPEVLVQTDPIPIVVQPGASPPDPVELLVMAAGGVIALGLATVLVTNRLVTNGRRHDHRVEHSGEPETAELVFVDGLTGIANRRRFDIDLDYAVGHAAATHTPVAVAMFDVDHFKNFNDNNGHQAGDNVLRSVAELISANLRSTDVVYRYGGEEFVALLPGATTEDAYDVVERIRQIVERTVFQGASSQPYGTVTLSVGVSASIEVSAHPDSDGATLVRAADIALSEAKTSGRNRVVVEPHSV